MKKTTLASLLICSLMSGASIAANSQFVSLCVDVKDNAAPLNFKGKFVSSDIFDTGNRTGEINNGRSCANHEYKHGPKNLKFSIKVSDSHAVRDIQLLPDESCAFFKKQASGHFESGYIRNSLPMQSRLITLTQAPPMNGYKFSYFMHCEYVNG